MDSSELLSYPPLVTPTPASEFWRVFDTEPVILFVGSAISLWEPSALPSAGALVTSLVQALSAGTGLEPVVRAATGRSWPRLETALEELHYCVGDLAAASLVSLTLGQPNRYHEFIAKHLPRIRTVYTTNQDELIEAALRSAGYVEGRDFAVWLPGVAEPDAALMQLVKLHGTVSNPSLIRTTVRQVHRGLPAAMAQRLKDDLAIRRFCFMGYSGNDVDIRPILRAANLCGTFWIDREVNAFAGSLAIDGKHVFPVVTRLETFLDAARPLVAGPFSLSPMPMEIAAIDPFLRACVVSRCIGLSRPSANQAQADSAGSRLHRWAQTLVRPLSRGHAQEWRIWYDSAERELRAGGWLSPLRAFLHYRRGWRRSAVDPRGTLLCLRGMWMSCDLMFLGLLPATYALGLRAFARPARAAALRISEDREYWLGLVDLLEVRALIRTGRIDPARVLAERMLRADGLGPHLRGHALRFLAQCRSMTDEEGNVELLIDEAVEQFTYVESYTDVRNVRRTAVACAIWRRDLVAARAHFGAAIGEHPDRREAARLQVLRLALMAARLGWWRIARWLGGRG